MVAGVLKSQIRGQGGEKSALWRCHLATVPGSCSATWTRSCPKTCHSHFPWLLIHISSPRAPRDHLVRDTRPSSRGHSLSSVSAVLLVLLVHLVHLVHLCRLLPISFEDTCATVCQSRGSHLADEQKGGPGPASPPTNLQTLTRHTWTQNTCQPPFTQ